MAIRFNQITVVGVGLIGGSFALAAKRAGIAAHILGWDTGKSLDAAISAGVIDATDDAFATGERSEADFVYLACPVGAIIDFLKTRAALLKPGAIATDAGSTKRAICQAAAQGLSPRVAFVGGHPMAGSHRSGVEFARGDLFDGAPYAVVESSHSNGLEAVVEVVRALGAKPVKMSAEAHDRAVARTSHAPQLISTALAAVNAGMAPEDLAGAGFLDMTRLAASQWSVWRDICITNADEIAAALAEALGQIEAARAALAERDFLSLQGAFDSANDVARRLHQRE